jgi:Tol biopolymer transport system component
MPVWGWVAVAAALIVGAVGASLLGSGGEASPGPVREVLLDLGSSDIALPYIAPDGSFLVYFAGDSLGTGTYLYRFDGRPAERLPMQTDGFNLWVSEDSRTIIASDPLQAYSVETGAVTELIPQSSRAFGILRPGTPEYVIAGNAGPLLSVAVGGGEPTPITRLDGGEFSHSRQSLLPDGRGLMTRWPAADPDSASIQLVDFDSGERTDVLTPGFSPQYLASGHILFYRGREFRVFVQPFDPAAGRVTGPAVDLGPRFVARAVSVDRSGMAFVGAARAEASVQWDIFVRNPDATGEVLPMQVSSAMFLPAVARDGSRIAFPDPGAGAITVYNVDQREPDWTFRSTAGGEMAAALSFDGRQLAYTTGLRNERETVLRDLETGREDRLELGIILRIAWISERELALVRWDRDRNVEILLTLDLETGSEDVRAESDGRGVNGISPSPDGSWIALSKRADIRLIPTETDGLPIELGPGQFPQWSPDGTRIWFAAPNGLGSGHYPIEATTTSIVRIGTAQDFATGERVRVHPVDGDRLFLFGIAGAPTGARQGVRMIENWLDEVRRIAPPGF